MVTPEILFREELDVIVNGMVVAFHDWNTTTIRGPDDYQAGLRMAQIIAKLKRMRDAAPSARGD